MSLPTGLAVPKYFSARGFDKTAVNGSESALVGFPSISLKSNTLKRLSSAKKSFSSVYFFSKLSGRRIVPSYSRRRVICSASVKSFLNSETFKLTETSPLKEADLKQLKISVKSPIGAALLGRSKGEKITIQIPAGAMDLEILDISI